MASSPIDAAPRAPGSRAVGYARLRAWFDDCVDLPEGERLAWIERHVPEGDAQLELALMLASDASPAGVFGIDPLRKLGDYVTVEPATVLPDQIGMRCGAFRLVRLLGTGGQGAVYLGERDDGDFVQQVAVKVLREAILDADDLRRFRRERDILARFEHPGVARLIDAGVGANGLPFLAMEYVDGDAIDVWCNRHVADRATRLRLLVELCGVLAAAHRRLIVHRDLKPSNVMVSREGRVKVLDFGIARLLDDDAPIRTNTLMLTPGYGAPEQRVGEPATPASDVFALGAMLRELITRQTPPRRRDERWPPWPATVPEELRWIFERCCTEAPLERYRDAAELGEDIARYLARQPVRAHPPSRWYRASKFVARHRGGVTLTALLLLTTLLGFGATLWQTRIARQHSAHATAEAQRAKATSDFLLSVFEAAQEDLPQDARPTPDVLAQAAAKKLDEDTTLPPQSRSDFLAALARVARSGNDPAAALSLYERAIAALDGAPHEARERLNLEVAQAWVLSELGRAAEAEAALAPRLAALRSVPDATAVDGLWAHARALGELGRNDEQLAALNEARTAAAQAYAPDALVPIQIEGDYGLALHEAGRHREAADITAALLRHWRDAGHPLQRDYAVGLHNLTLMYRALGELDRAEASIREALALNARIHPGPHADTAFMQQLLARILIERGKPDAAEAPLRDALAVLAEQLGPAHRGTIGATNAFGQLDMERFRFDAAIDTLQSAETICAGIADGSAGSTCTSTRQLLADALLRAGRLDAAADMAQRAAQQRQALDGEDSPDNGPPQRVLADVRLAQGRPADALALLDAAIARYAAAGIGENLDLIAQHETRARALLALGRADEALVDIDLATPMLARLAPHHAGRQLRLLATRALVLSGLSRRDDARAAAEDALTREAARAALASGEWAQLQALARRSN